MFSFRGQSQFTRTTKMSYLLWCPKRNLLCGYDGENDDPVFVWSYSTFEKYHREAITPSMYEFMSSYVLNNISTDQLYDLQGHVYQEGELEEYAVDAYYEVPILRRIEMHNTTIRVTKDKLDIAQKKRAELNAAPKLFVTMRSEYDKWVDKHTEIETRTIEQLTRHLEEEYLWRST